MRRHRTISVDVDLDVSDLLDELTDNDILHEMRERGLGIRDLDAVTEAEIERVIDLIERRLLVEAIDALRRLQPKCFMPAAERIADRYNGMRKILQPTAGAA